MFLSPITSLSSFKVCFNLWGASKNTVVYSVLSIFFRNVFRSDFLFGKNPKDRNCLPENADTDRAAVTADGPGMGTTSKPSLMTALTSSTPGSLIVGVPASDTRAISIFDKEPTSLGIFKNLLCSL